MNDANRAPQPEPRPEPQPERPEPQPQLGNGPQPGPQRDPQSDRQREPRNEPQPAASEARHPVEVLAEEFARRLRAGEQPTLDEYTAAHPGLADDIRALFPALVALERAKNERQEEQAARAPRRRTVVPERLGDFRILREIGRGGMGIVYEAEQQSLGRRVAVKVLPRHALLDAKWLERFQREAQTAAALHHTNIVPVFGTGEHEGLHYFVMQHIDGVGLDRVLAAMRRSAAEAASTRIASTAAASGRSSASTAAAATGPTSRPWAAASTSTVANDATATTVVAAAPALASGGAAEAVAHGTASPAASSPEEERAARIALVLAEDRGRHQGRAFWQRLARIGAQVAHALHHAHEHGTLHRDVKPANLLIDEHDFVWVADFGLAKAMQQDALTRAEDVVGTLQYMAPEQLQGRGDRRTDVFCLGLTLYELATLRSAFRGHDRSELLHTVASARIERPSRLAPAMPRDLETVLLKALASEPAHRYADAGELAADLERFAAGRPVRARPASAARHAWLWARRNRVAAALAASTAVALVTAAVVGWLGYGAASAALARAEQRGEEARCASTRAETNLALALQAFEDVFDQVVGRDPALAFVQDTDTGEYSAASSRVVSERDVALLQQVLAFYDKFIAENAGNEALQRENARAHRRVGDIHQRLGQLAEAERAYQEAQRLTEALPRGAEQAVALAALHNELGRVHAANGEPRRALRDHESALAILPTSGEAGVAARLQEARTHDLIAAVHLLMAGPEGPGPGPRRMERPPGRDRDGRGVRDPREREGPDREGRDREERKGSEGREGPRERESVAPVEREEPGSGERDDPVPRGRDGLGPRDRRLRPGGGDPNRPQRPPGGARQPPPRASEHVAAAAEHARAALALMGGLLGEDAGNPEFRLEQARALRWSWLAGDGPGRAGGEFDRAVAVLHALIAEFPAADVYVAELVETYALLEPRAAAQRDVLKQVETAYADAKELVSQRPTVPAYRASQARLASVLGRALVSPAAPVGARARAEDVLRDAVRLHGELASRTNAAPLHVMLLGHAYLDLARVVRRRQGAAEARQLLQKAIAEHEALLRDRVGGRPARPMPLRPLLEELAACCHELGDAQGEAAAEQRLREMTRPPR